MRFVSPLIAVKDIQVSKDFYAKVLDQHVTLDLGDNVCLSEKLAIQRNYVGLVGVDSMEIAYKSNDHELYFEEDDFDAFERRLSQIEGIEYLHRAKEYPWGQRVVRLYDPDGHIIEVGESMECVFRRFHAQGMSVEAVAKRTMHPIEFVKRYIG